MTLAEILAPYGVSDEEYLLEFGEALGLPPQARRSSVVSRRETRQRSSGSIRGLDQPRDSKGLSNR